jgi:hypothetical protein
MYSKFNLSLVRLPVGGLGFVVKILEPSPVFADAGSFDFVRLAPHFAQEDTGFSVGIVI